MTIGLIVNVGHCISSVVMFLVADMLIVVSGSRGVSVLSGYEYGHGLVVCIVICGVCIGVD